MAIKTLHQLKLEICDIGRRIYNKGFAAGNDGNISYRLNDREVLCTPTMISKGFMKPEDLCTVDMTGKQLSGNRKRTSEIMLHLAIMKERPELKSVVHCHPPHATAFAIAREPIPQCVLPEVEVFLGDVPITKYETPGGQAFADTILPFVKKSNVIILANHGTVSFGDTVELAYWWTEILDAYCRMLMLSRDLGRVNYLSDDKARELLDLKTKWGYKDARLAPGMENCDICANDVFRHSWEASGIQRKAFDAPPPAKGQGNSQASGTSQTGSAQPNGPNGSKQNGAAKNGSRGVAPIKTGPTGKETPKVGESEAAEASVRQRVKQDEPKGDIDQEKLIQMITDRVVAALAGK